MRIGPIQSLWIGDELSDLEVLCINSFLKNGYDFHLYTYGTIKNAPKDCVILDGNEFLEESEVFSYKVGVGKGSFSAFSNLFRYKMLYDIGGIWCDTDVINLNPIPNMEYLFASEKDGDEIVCASCFIKAPKGSAFAKYCYDKASSVDREKLEWGQIGPKLVGEAVKTYGLSDFIVPFKKFNHVPWYSAELFFYDDPENMGEMLYESIASEAYCIHMWNEVWRRLGLDKSAEFPKGCFYEVLKSKIKV